jgi:hypothetical protein
MAVHQLLVGASPGDAVTGAALDLRAVLRRIGPSDVFANYIEPELVDDVRSLGELAGRRAEPGDVVVYHASIGEPDVAALLLERRESLVVVFHNVTPAAYFATIDPHLAARLAAGRVELAALASRADLALAVSEFNAADLGGVSFGSRPQMLATVSVMPSAIGDTRMRAKVTRARNRRRSRRRVVGRLVVVSLTGPARREAALETRTQVGCPRAPIIGGKW